VFPEGGCGVVGKMNDWVGERLTGEGPAKMVPINEGTKEPVAKEQI
jgi:hypothetical protein